MPDFKPISDCSLAMYRVPAAHRDYPFLWVVEWHRTYDGHWVGEPVIFYYFDRWADAVAKVHELTKLLVTDYAQQRDEDIPWDTL
ncbi:MAG: hypothetical protein AAFU34_15660 [Pseudomonadota bacterium]